MEVLEEERKTVGLTQNELARKIGLSSRSYRGYIYKERQMAPALEVRVSRVMRSPRLAVLALAQFCDNPFAPAILDVDDHPAQQIVVALKELAEAMDAIDRIDPVRPDTKTVEYAADQLMDIIHLAPVAIGSWSKTYGVDAWRIRERNLAKLRQRGYLKTEGEVAA